MNRKISEQENIKFKVIHYNVKCVGCDLAMEMVQSVYVCRYVCERKTGSSGKGETQRIGQGLEIRGYTIGEQ